MSHCPRLRPTIVTSFVIEMAREPSVGMSFEVGYRKYPTPFVGFETKPLSLSLAGHWYVK